MVALWRSTPELTGEIELTVRVFCIGGTSDPDQLIGEATIAPGLPSVSAEPYKLQLSPAGSGAIVCTVGAPGLLQRYGINESSIFEELGPVKPSLRVNIDDINGQGPLMVGTSPLPEQLRGIWWLQAQGNQSALMSFGGPVDDGAGCSQGRVSPDGTYQIRVAGDRVWSRATGPTLQASASQKGHDEKVYTFKFDSATDPRHAFIEGYLLFGVEMPTWLCQFKMSFIEGGNTAYPGSLTWKRTNWVFNCHQLDSAGYSLVQVVDQYGARISPAWEEFVKYQSSSGEIAEEGRGFLWYHQS